MNAKNIYELLLRKEIELKELTADVEALRRACKLLSEKKRKQKPLTTKREGG